MNQVSGLTDQKNKKGGLNFQAIKDIDSIFNSRNNDAYATTPRVDALFPRVNKETQQPPSKKSKESTSPFLRGYWAQGSLGAWHRSLSPAPAPFPCPWSQSRSLVPPWSQSRSLVPPWSLSQSRSPGLVPVPGPHTENPQVRP